MLTQKQIEKYQAIYLRVFGKEVSHEQALKEGSALVDLVRLVGQDKSSGKDKNNGFPVITGQQSTKL